MYFSTNLNGLLNDIFSSLGGPQKQVVFYWVFCDGCVFFVASVSLFPPPLCVVILGCGRRRSWSHRPRWHTPVQHYQQSLSFYLYTAKTLPRCQMIPSDSMCVHPTSLPSAFTALLPLPLSFCVHLGFNIKNLKLFPVPCNFLVLISAITTLRQDVPDFGNITKVKLAEHRAVYCIYLQSTPTYKW